MKQERENCCWEQVVSLGQEESPPEVIQEGAGLSARGWDGVRGGAWEWGWGRAEGGLGRGREGEGRRGVHLRCQRHWGYMGARKMCNFFLDFSTFSVH